MSDLAAGPKTSWTIGKAPGCDVVVGKEVVSQKHCRLSLEGDKYILEDLGSTNGTFVNGYRLEPNTPVYVSKTDRLTLGQNLPMPWPETASRSNSPGPASASGVLTIGRSPDSAIQLDYPMVSWEHARITRVGDQWIIEDLNSSNGTALNQIDNKIQRSTLQPTDDIYLGSYKISAGRILREKHVSQGAGAFERVRFQGNRMVLGRDPSAEYPLNYPMISWHHAALERAADGVYVEDLGSRNGTYVNGARISGRTLVRTGDEIGLGSFHFQLLEDGALAKREYIGNVTIEVNSVAVNAPNGDRLLDSVSLTVFPSELVALMGPAGAGKTTFLKAINGYTRPAAGRVLFNGADLYEYYDRFRLQMSYVPQDDIVHAQLTVREALYFSAKLRTDLKDDEIEQRIDKVLTSLEIQDKKNTIIGSPEKKVLSGGQRKRVNIAMELIAAAPVIFLDEPTSGLSSYDAENVVRVLKKLSTEGNTIITTIHQPSLDIFKQFDSLIMISRDRGGRGALAYFGPAHPDSIEFFDPVGARAAKTQPGKELNPEMLLSGLAKKPTADWVNTYEQSRYKKLFVADRSGKVPSAANQAAEKTAVRKFGLGQWWTLVRRNYLVKARDRAQATILLVQAPIFGLLLGAVYGPLKVGSNVTNPGPKDWQSVVRHAVGLEFLLVVAAIWFGCNNVARDIVGEWTVFQRERMVSLKLPSYVFSKLAVSAVLSFFQCLVLLGIVALICQLQGNFLATLGILYLSSLVGTALGLCVSARASTTEAAIAMLPLILLPIIALGGGLNPVYEPDGSSKPIQKIAAIVPSRWATEANLLMEAKVHKHGSVNYDPENVCTDLPSYDDPRHPKPMVHDLAEVQLPVYHPEDSCEAQAPAAAPGESSLKPASEPANENRTPTKIAFAILGGMLVFWTATSLVFLKMRDIQ
jgi:ABC-type multidrug transport system ATPase subunit/pSer/pThr/pTyr-binding forkhead associated (FHA) protein